MRMGHRGVALGELNLSRFQVELFGARCVLIGAHDFDELFHGCGGGHTAIHQTELNAANAQGGLVSVALFSQDGEAMARLVQLVDLE